MLLIEREYFPRSPLVVREVAENAGIARETLSRIISGKQSPSFAEGGSAERIAQAVGWTGDLRELFAEVEG